MSCILINKYATGLARFRLLPTQSDRALFFACIEPNGSRLSGRISDAYRFFVPD